MPACSTSRARCSSRAATRAHERLRALGPDDLANSQVSPFEMTAPQAAEERGYRSALSGKLPSRAAGEQPLPFPMPASPRWDYFSGWLDDTGDPSSIDTTAGGVAPAGTWTCGFVSGGRDVSPRDPNQHGADRGACYAADDTCREMKTSRESRRRTCRDGGGIFDPGRTCQTPRPPTSTSRTLSGHYVSRSFINHQSGAVRKVPSTDIRARTYRGTAPVDAAIAWIKRQPADRPWMVTVSFASAQRRSCKPPRHCWRPGAQQRAVSIAPTRSRNGS